MQTPGARPARTREEYRLAQDERRHRIVSPQAEYRPRLLCRRVELSSISRRTSCRRSPSPLLPRCVLHHATHQGTANTQAPRISATVPASWCAIMRHHHSTPNKHPQRPTTALTGSSWWYGGTSTTRKAPTGRRPAPRGASLGPRPILRIPSASLTYPPSVNRLGVMLCKLVSFDNSELDRPAEVVFQIEQGIGLRTTVKFECFVNELPIQRLNSPEASAAIVKCLVDLGLLTKATS